MKTEALESPHVVEKQFKQNKLLVNNIADEIKKINPYSIVSIARGSSDHAAQYLNFLSMLKLGKLSTSLSMSILTLYKAQLDISHSLGIAISQSGQSPDVIFPLKYFTDHAPGSLSLINNIDSPLGKNSKWIIPLHAGEEKSVAATKSFIASLFASTHLIAAWAKDYELLKNLEFLSDDLALAQGYNWTSAIEKLKNAKRIMIVGRGLGLSLALEAALKFKETCAIQAEAFSAAEIKHGPLALIEKGYPLLVFATRGPTLQNMLDLALDMKNRGAHVILAAPSFVKEKDLTIHTTHSEELDILSAAQSFYLMVEELSRAQGLDPDHPRHLNKITKTN